MILKVISNIFNMWRRQQVNQIAKQEDKITLQGLKEA